MDVRLRQLARDFQSYPAQGSAQAFLWGMERSGLIPPPVHELLNIVNTQTGLPSLYFVCGAMDEGDEQEATRITWLQTTFSEHRYLWMIICRNLLDFVAHDLLQEDTRPALEILLSYAGPTSSKPHRSRRKEPSWGDRYPGHQPQNGPAEYRLFRKQVFEAIELLKGVGPRTGPPSTFVLQEQIQIWEKWSAITCDEGYLSFDENYWFGQEGWERRNNLQSSIYNLVEVIHHLFLSLAGRVGEPHLIDGEFNDAYSGGPFFKHWTREHGSLNPGYHLNFGETTRLNELVMPNGQINWFVVFSNCLVGCYFTRLWTLKVRSQEPISEAGHAREALEQKYEATAKHFQGLFDQYLAARPDYPQMSRKVMNKLSNAQRTRIENKQNAIETQVMEAHPELNALQAQQEETASLLDETREAANQSQEVVYERRFWQDTQSVFLISTAEYLIS